MTKYNIEGGINFYDELYKSLDDYECENKTEADENKCLITSQPLIDKFVTLVCGHKFNYIPLFKDILNHKKKFNNMEGKGKLGENDVRCPYCRRKQPNLLPYYEELNLPKTHGVNWIDSTKTQYNPDNNYKYCQYKCLNPNYNENIAESSNNPKFIFSCVSYGMKINHYVASDENYGDEHVYCWTHKNQMIKMYKKQIVDNKKEEIKKEKLQQKILKQNEEKMKKEELKKTKLLEKKNKNESVTHESNIVLGLLNVIDASNNVIVPSNNVTDPSNNVIVNWCVEIIKTGTNKGTTCGCKVFEEKLCKRHFNMKNKIINIDK